MLNGTAGLVKDWHSHEAVIRTGKMALVLSYPTQSFGQLAFPGRDLLGYDLVGRSKVAESWPFLGAIPDHSISLECGHLACYGTLVTAERASLFFQEFW